MISDDTIVAISSAVGSAPRIIVRLSGTNAFSIASSIADNLPEAHTARACRLWFRENGVQIPATVYRFAAPRSSTGEDVIEFHIPGNPLLARMLVTSLVESGARHAEPGEFTARAFFNNRMGLTEAEGIGALISAQNDAQLDAARRLMSGELASRLAPPMDSLCQTLALLEAGIDFVDEPISFITREQLLTGISTALRALQKLLEQSPRLERLSHEPTIVLAGRPNAGKSTLLNVLADHPRAIVSHVSGTTRDVLSASVRLAHGLARVIDVAGLEDSTGARTEIDSAMRDAACRAIASADVVVLLIDATDTRAPVALPRAPDLIVRSKSDLRAHRGALAVSARTGDGIEELKNRLDAICFGSLDQTRQASVALAARHVAAIEQACAALQYVAARIDEGPEIVALDLREALDHLGSVLGQFETEDLLGRIFATFCIGK